MTSPVEGLKTGVPPVAGRHSPAMKFGQGVNDMGTHYSGRDAGGSKKADEGNQTARVIPRNESHRLSRPLSSPSHTSASTVQFASAADNRSPRRLPNTMNASFRRLFFW